MVCIGRPGGCLRVGLIIILWCKNEWGNPHPSFWGSALPAGQKNEKKHKVEQFWYWFLKKYHQVRLFFTVELSLKRYWGDIFVVPRGSFSELNTDPPTALTVDIVLFSVYNTAPCWYLVDQVRSPNWMSSSKPRPPSVCAHHLLYILYQVYQKTYVVLLSV